MIALALLLSAQAALPVVPVTLPSGQVVLAEVARSDAERAEGLWHRERLAEDQGMLFVFERPGRYPFWMPPEMVLRLDLIFLGPDRRILHIEHDLGPCPGRPCPQYAAPALPMQPDRTQYVLEVRSGVARRAGLKAGDRLLFSLERLR